MEEEQRDGTATAIRPLLVGFRPLLVSCCVTPFRFIIVFVLLCGIATLVCDAAGPRVIRGVSRRVTLAGPDGIKANACQVVQVVDSRRDPQSYYMDVDSVMCASGAYKVVKVRLHFHQLGNYVRYELPSGGNLTKWGHRPFSAADHKKLHEILSDSYSQLKSIGWDEITLPQASVARDLRVDGISGATALSKRDVVVVGAAHTCFTLWHWSHGEVANAIREMTISASDKRDLVNYLQSGKDSFAIFAAGQLQQQGIFDTKTVAEVRNVVRHGNERVVDFGIALLGSSVREDRCRLFPAML